MPIVLIDGSKKEKQRERGNEVAVCSATKFAGELMGLDPLYTSHRQLPESTLDKPAGQKSITSEKELQ